MHKMLEVNSTIFNDIEKFFLILSAILYLHFPRAYIFTHSTFWDYFICKGHSTCNAVLFG